jgi:hypothetical protein
MDDQRGQIEHDLSGKIRLGLLLEVVRARVRLLEEALEVAPVNRQLWPSRSGGSLSTGRTSPAGSSDTVLKEVASGNVARALARSPPPNGYTTVGGRSFGRRAAMNGLAASTHDFRYSS